MNIRSYVYFNKTYSICQEKLSKLIRRKIAHTYYLYAWANTVILHDSIYYFHS